MIKRNEHNSPAQRVLIVEDVPADAELAKREIHKEIGPCEFRRVETRDDYLRELMRFIPDIIISDYMMPGFVVTIPGIFSDELVEKKRGESIDTDQGEITGLSVLIVEDEAINRMYLKTVLEKHNYRVLEAKNGEEAVEQALRNRPDIVLMDIGLPKMNGIDATRHILQSDKSNDATVIALTAHVYPEEKETFLRAGMKEVVVKPFHEEALITVLKKYGQKK